MSPPSASGLTGTVRRLSARAFVVFGRVNGSVSFEGCRVAFDSGAAAKRVVADVFGSGQRAFAVIVAQADTVPVGRVRVLSRGGQPLFEASWPANRRPALVDLARLATDIEPAQRPRMLRHVLETAATWLQLYDDPEFLRLSRAAATGRIVSSLPIRKAIALAPKLLYYRIAAGGLQGDVESVLLVGTGGVRRNAFRPRVVQSPAGGAEIELIVERPDVLGTALASMLLFTRKDAVTASVEPGDVLPLPALLPFLESLGSAASETRAYLLQTLKPYLPGEPRLAAVLQEALRTLRAPPPRARVATPSISAGVDLAVPTPDGGLFVAGWLSDPHGLVQAIEAVSPFGTVREMPVPKHRFRRPDIEREQAANGERRPGDRSGFLAYAEAQKDPLAGGQFSLRLKLLSGAAIELVAPPGASSPAAARDQILSSVPYPQLSAGMMADCIAPAVASLHRAHLASKAVEEELSFGPPCRAPTWSVVIPLYRDLEFLQFQLAAFATDPDFREAEIIFVLDSPEDRDRLERLLRSFLFVYQLPVRVLIHSGNFGYAPAVNTGAAVASGEWLVPLNSDVVPIDSRWLSRLRAASRRGQRVGIAAPKLLFEDDSLQHAGLYYGQDLAGRWLNRHFYKGYPRDFPAANVSRMVPGVTGACMLIERVLWERIRGLDEEYVIADYEDSDLCLRMLDAGRTCWYEPTVELYHLERQSVVKHEGYMRSVVSDYNRSLHQRRWEGLMLETMRGFGGDLIGSLQRGPIEALPATGLAGAAGDGG